MSSWKNPGGEGLGFLPRLSPHGASAQASPETQAKGTLEELYREF